MRPNAKTMLTNPALAATLLTGLAVSPALAQAPFKLGHIEINGVTSVPTQPLKEGLKDKPGQMITVNDVLADQDQLTKELEDAHVGGRVKTSLRNNPHNVKDIIFDVTDTGVQKPVVTTTALHLDHVSFTGNQYMNADELTAAAQMKPGDVVTDQSLADALKRIADAYKKASDAKAKDAGKTTVAPQVTYPQPGHVDIAWVFTQTSAAKKKKRNTEDEGFKTE
jgi:outer membrane protein assembly factor BamA